MKRLGYIYEKIYDKENIRTAIWKASEKKRNHNYVKKVLDNENYYIDKIHGMLVSKTYEPTKPIIKTIQDHSSGKVRVIHKPQFFPDQIIHWALILQIEPIIF